MGVGLAAVHARREIEEIAVECGDAVGLARISWTAGPKVSR
jgi:hypothetical protein